MTERALRAKSGPGEGSVTPRRVTEHALRAKSGPDEGSVIPSLHLTLLGQTRTVRPRHRFTPRVRSQKAPITATPSSGPIRGQKAQRASMGLPEMR